VGRDGGGPPPHSIKKYGNGIVVPAEKEKEERTAREREAINQLDRSR